MQQPQKIHPQKTEKSWHFDPLIERKAAISEDTAPYQILDATSKDKEKVVGFYQQCPVEGYDIGNVQVIYNRDFNQGFEIQIKKLQERDKNPAFAPQWGNGNDPLHRAKTNERLKGIAAPHTDPDYPAVKILPLWHGTRPEILDSIFRAGYANLATLDAGYFGKGLYSAYEAQYSYSVYAKGALILNWVAVFSAYPVVDGDMDRLMGGANYGNYDAHFIPVRGYGSFFAPCKPDQKPKYTEVVVFESSSCLPRYLVELQSNSPQKSKLLPEKFQIPLNKVAVSKTHNKGSQSLLSSNDLNFVNNQVLCVVTHVGNLAIKGSKEYKERIYEGRTILLLAEFQMVNRKLKSALSHPQNLIDNFPKEKQEKVIALYRLMGKLLDLINRFSIFIEKLPETSRFQKHLSKIKQYKSNFTKFDKGLTDLKVKLSHSLSELGLENIVSEISLNKESQEKEKDTAKAFEEDENKLYATFQHISSEKYSLKPDMKKEEGDADKKEHQKIVQQQIASLKKCINPDEKSDRGKRLDSSLLIPSCELNLLEKMTNGTTGSVYRGAFRKQQVVVKTLEGITSDAEEKRLFNEIKTMAKVRNKYITQLYGISWEKDFKCLIMEYMPKGSLYNCLGQQAFKIEEQKKIALEIAYGLYNLQSINMVHGNLNSYNVLLNEANEPKLTDFSCAETRQVSLTSVKNTRSPIESIEWTAPELFCLSPKRTHQSDIYSFGMILWEIFTGKHPFAEMPRTPKNCQVLINKLINGLRESLDDFPSSSIAEIIKSCWLKNPEERPSIEEVIDQLESYRPMPQEEEKIIVSLKTASKANNPYAQHNLALRYLKGAGVEKNPQAAYDLFCKAAGGGCCYSKIHLVIMSARGIGTPLDKNAALKYYQEVVQEQILIEKCSGMIGQLSLLLFPPANKYNQKINPAASASTHQQGMFDHKSSVVNPKVLNAAPSLKPEQKDQKDASQIKKP